MFRKKDTVFTKTFCWEAERYYLLDLKAMGRGKGKKGALRVDDTQVRLNFLFQAAHVVPSASGESISRGLVDTLRQTSAKAVSSL